MEVVRKPNYTCIKQTQNSVNLFFNELQNRYQEFVKDHLIIHFSEKKSVLIEELLLFLDLNNQHRKNGTSFVLICNGANIDEIPDEIQVVPTLTEALDILEMDAIERELGL